MIREWTLSRYFARQYLTWFSATLGALAGIVFLFEIAELMRRAAASNSEAGFGLILKMGAYKLPETVEQILPFVVLFSCMYTYWKMTRSQELIIARAAGVSAWRFLAPALIVTLAFSFVNITVLNPVGAAFNSRYKALELRYLQHAPTLELTGAGLWLRQQGNAHHYLIHADHASENPLTLSPMIAFIYDEQDRYLGRIDAPEAVLRDGYWEIGNAWFNWNQQLPQHVDTYRMATTLTLSKIQESMSPPNTISFWELPKFIFALKTIGLPAYRHELEFEGLLAQPVMLAAMVSFAALFSLRISRSGGVMRVAGAGAVLGITIFVLNIIVRALGANQVLPVELAAWAVPLVALSLSNAGLLYIEDG